VSVEDIDESGVLVVNSINTDLRQGNVRVRTTETALEIQRDAESRKGLDALIEHLHSCCDICRSVAEGWTVRRSRETGDARRYSDDKCLYRLDDRSQFGPNVANTGGYRHKTT
jgi:hypothetical protein